MPPDSAITVTHLPEITSHHVDVLRLDLIHPVTGGNKYYKLKYNLREALKTEHHTICTYGGPFSNHIAATAQACNEAGLKSIGIIRGEDRNNSPTIKFARENGMKLIFVSRETYAHSNEKSFIGNLHRELGEFFLVPEGGNNTEGIRGAAEIIDKREQYDYIVCACGTGTTYAGILSANKKSSVVIGISVLKGKNELPGRMMSLSELSDVEIGGDEQLEKQAITTHCILSAYAFSGYAAFDQELIDFKSKFENRTHIALDYVYTAKLFFAVFDLCAKGKISHGSRVLVVHSGGIQGNIGFEQRYQRKLNL